MLSKFLTITAFCASLFIFIGCGSGSPIDNYANSPIVASSGKKNLEDIRRTIILAATRIGWQMREIKLGEVEATVFRDGKMAKVDIAYTTENFSITYKDSSNLRYDGTNIHPTYNKWVNRLHRNIRSSLANM